MDREVTDRRQWAAEEDFSHPVVNMKFSFPGERGNLYYCVFAGKSHADESKANFRPARVN